MTVKSIQDPRYLELIGRLRAGREHSGLSQAELGHRVGRPQSYIAKIETGERRIDLIEALGLCEALGISLEEITPSALRHLVRRENKETAR